MAQEIYEQGGNSVNVFKNPQIDPASMAEQERERVLKSIEVHLREAEAAMSALSAEREQKVAEWERREGALRQVIGVCRHGLDSPMQAPPQESEQISRPMYEDR